MRKGFFKLGLFLFVIPSARMAYGDATFGPEFEFRSRSHVVMSALCAAAPLSSPMAVWNATDSSEETSRRVGFATLAGAIGAVTGVAGTFLCADAVSNYKIRRMVSLLQEKCKTSGCVIREVEVPTARNVPKKVNRIVYPDGTWFQLNTDTFTVEIQASPKTTMGLGQAAERLNSDLFDTARKVGLRVPQGDHWGNGGHLNIGVQSAFEGDAKLFRNFVVDFVNHYELSTGILLLDNHNARSPMVDAGVRARLAQVVERFDRGEFAGIRDFSEAIQREVFRGNGRGWAISVRTIPNGEVEPDAKTVEIRSLRSQNNADEFYELSRLFESRIEFLKRQGGLVEFRRGAPDLSPEHAVTEYRRYVTEAGLSWETYRKFMPRKYDRYDVSTAAGRCMAEYARVKTQR